MRMRGRRDAGAMACLLAAVGLAGLAVLMVAPARAQTISEAWMAHCARNLAPEQLPEQVVRNYCQCMDGVGEEAEMLTWSQTELEPEIWLLAQPSSLVMRLDG